MHIFPICISAMWSARLRWIRVAVSISSDDNHYTTAISLCCIAFYIYIYIYIYIYRTAILTLNFLTTLIPYSGPHLALLLLPRGEVLNRRPPDPPRHPPATRWPLFEPLDCPYDWLTLLVGTCIYIYIYIYIYNFPTPWVLVVNPRDPLPAVKPHIACFPVIPSFKQLEHLVPEIPDWRLCQSQYATLKLK